MQHTLLLTPIQSLLSFDDCFYVTPDFLRLLAGVHLGVQVEFGVKIHQWGSLGMIRLQSRSECFFVVVRAMDEILTSDLWKRRRGNGEMGKS